MEETENEIDGEEVPSPTGEADGADESTREETGEGAGPQLRPSVLDIQVCD